MRILFVMRHAGYVRNFEWVVRALVERGHEVHLGFNRSYGRSRGSEEEREIVDRLASDFAGVTHDYLPVRQDRWASLANELRQSISYLRYLRPEYAAAEKLRVRWARRTPQVVVRVASRGLFGTRLGREVLDRFLRSCERAVPRADVVDDYLRQEPFDVVLATPLVDGPTQVDWLRSARAAGIPALFATASWDNLTLKGLVFEPPDRTYVWNEIQRREAAEYHGIDPSTVAVVGAHTFDHWFEWQPRTTREEFCEHVGVDPDRPFLLYVCSSGLIALDERPIVERWLERVREHDVLRDVGVLVRPHVKGAVWLENPLADVENAAVWPPTGSNPIHTERRNAYYDSIHHAAAVVGINTTAMVEAAIIGRRTFTFVTPEVRGGQEGTLHFQYLARDNGGAVAVARSLDEHAEQLGQALSSEDENDPWRSRFLESFVRPRGVDHAGAPVFVADLESFATAFVPGPASRAPWLGRAGLTALRLLSVERTRAPAKPRRSLRLPSGVRMRKRLKHYFVVQLARARLARRMIRTAVRHHPRR